MEEKWTPEKTVERWGAQRPEITVETCIKKRAYWAEKQEQLIWKEKIKTEYYKEAWEELINAIATGKTKKELKELAEKQMYELKNEKL